MLSVEDFLFFSSKRRSYFNLISLFVFSRESTEVPGSDSVPSQSQMEDILFEPKKEKSVKRIVYNLNSDDDEDEEEDGDDDDDDDDDDDNQVGES